MILNYFPIKFEFDSYQVQTTPYEDGKLQELRSKYNPTHSFFRNGDDIVISNKDDEKDEELGDIKEKSVFDDRAVTSSLIKHIFFRTFKDRFADRVPIDFYPFRFFSSKEEDDIIREYLPTHLKDKVAYKKLIEIQLRETTIDGVSRFGFLINLKRNWIFNKSCLDLHDEGFDLTGIDVLHSEILPGLENVLAPNEEFIGQIVSVEESFATVSTNEGNQKLPLEELFIKKNKYNIANYLSFALSDSDSERLLNVVERKREEIYDPQNVIQELVKIAKGLFLDFPSKQPILFENRDGFVFTISTDPLPITNSTELQKPSFIFDHAATKTDVYADRGLSNYGPYDSATFDTKSPQIMAICHGNNRGSFTRFLANIKNGMANSKYFKKGLLQKYDLHDVAFNTQEINNYSFDEYVKAIKQYDAPQKPSLAIIEIPASFRKMSDRDNPYFRVKAKLLAMEIPVQFVVTENMVNHNEYILNSMVLQIYAKLGGIPWVLPSQPSVDREIVIGVGHSWLRRNQYKGAEQNRVVGITTFLSSDGQYLLGEKVKDVDYVDYFDELLQSLKNSIKRLEAEQGWEAGDTVRLIFHIFKPIKNLEFEVVSQLVKELDRFSIKFAFVTIGKSHPFLMFDPGQQGVQKYGRGNKIGKFEPLRSSNVFLDEETCIVQMLGPHEKKLARQGMSNPIMIRIRTPQGNYDNPELNSMLYYDLKYIVQQVYAFTYLSWRSFLPVEEPATMLYSNLIAKLLSKLRAVEGWDPDSLNYTLKRKKWFL